MIYRMHEIKRITGDRICEDFKKNPKLCFTNTSFGKAGQVLGSLQSNDKYSSEEITIVYTLEDEHWDSNRVFLKRNCETRCWKPEYSCIETNDVIMVLYKVVHHYGEEVYTDDEELANTANKIRKERRKYNSSSNFPNAEKKYDIKVGTAKHGKFVKEIMDIAGQKLKADAPIYLTIYKGTHAVWDYDTHQYVEKNYIETYVHYIYRNKAHTLRRSHIDY